MTRLPRCDSSVSTVCISSFSILPMGMPVQAETTSPTICASTQTRISGVSPCSCSSSVFECGQFRAQGFRIEGGLHRGGRCGSLRRRGGAAGAGAGAAGAGFQLAADFADLADQVALFLPARG